MKINWQIQKSRDGLILILILAFIPLVTSISLPIPRVTQAGIMVLIPIFIFLLYKDLLLVITNSGSTLSWEKGLWSFSNNDISIQGVKSKGSFTLGGLLFLSISNRDNHSVGLWLFPDSINGSEEDWHHLHNCYYLSDKFQE